MKKIVTVFAFALLCSGAYAQFNQGRMLVGGNLSFAANTHKSEFNNTTTTLGKTTSFGFTPQFGYFIIDNLAVGAGLNLTSTTSKADGSNDKDTDTDFSLVPMVRYYLDPGLFFHGQVGFGTSSSKNVDGSTTTTTKQGLFNWGIGAGYAYFLNDYVAIEPMVMYGSNIYTNKDNDAKLKISGISVNVGFQIYLGARN